MSAPKRNVTLLISPAQGETFPIPAAGTYLSEVVKVPAGGQGGAWLNLALQSVFTRSSGGTSLNAYLQTSFDDGTTWVDVANHAFLVTTATKISVVNRAIAPAAQAFAPGDGALTGDTIIQGTLGDRVRLKVVIVGTYVGTYRADFVLN
jgi:hypothetical protein